MAEPTKAPETDIKSEIDQVKLSDATASLEGEELTQAEQDKIAGAGGYGIEYDGS